jgi:two-component system, NtrC family, response regulator AtoC
MGYSVMTESVRGTAIDLQTVIDANDSAFVVIDENYTIIAANSAYCQSYGVDIDKVIGCKCHEISHNLNTPCHLNGEDCPHMHVFSTEQAVQVLHVHIDHKMQEEYVRIKGSPIRGADGKMYLGEAIFQVARAAELGCDEQRMFGRSPAFLAFIEELSSAARFSAPILLNGETGVGKEMAAKYVHKKSNRRDMPFVYIDCASISEEMFESELFGVERADLTGTYNRQPGLIESANGGTLFLDEIGEIPTMIQGKLLRAIETGVFRRLGSRDDVRVDIRVICATHNNLRKRVDQGTFRADLYYRCAGISITIPPLRERRGDIPALVNALASRLRDSCGDLCKITDDAMQMLTGYDYPGNIRELQNILQKASIKTTNAIITPDLLDLDHFNNIYNNPLSDRHGHSADGEAEQRSISELEESHIKSLLQQFNGHRARVADVLKISERTLYRKLKQYGLQDVGKSRSSARDESSQDDDAALEIQSDKPYIQKQREAAH